MSESGNVIYLGMTAKKKRAIIAALSAVVVLGLLIYFWKGYEVREVTVTGNEHYTVEEIENMVMEGPLGNNSLYLVFKYNHKKMEEVPFIETMDVGLISPNSISITVYEKAIAGCVEYLDRYMYFDKDGIVVESSKVRHSDMPYVTGLTFDHVVLFEKLPIDNDEVFQSILSITQLLSKYKIESDQIYFSPEMKVTLFFGKAKVEMGTLESIDEKMNELVGLKDQLAGLSGTLHLDSYIRKNDTGNITFQRDDVEQHEEIYEEIPELVTDENRDEEAGGDKKEPSKASEESGAEPEKKPAGAEKPEAGEKPKTPEAGQMQNPAEPQMPKEPPKPDMGQTPEVMQAPEMVQPPMEPAMPGAGQMPGAEMMPAEAEEGHGGE